MGTSIWDYPSLITKGPPTWRSRLTADSEESSPTGFRRGGGETPQLPTVEDIRIHVTDHGRVEVRQETENGEEAKITLPLDEVQVLARRLREAVKGHEVAH
ncbi:hypothetical protein ACFL3S_04275 [Gemmatimonadota bacterium]